MFEKLHKIIDFDIKKLNKLSHENFEPSEVQGVMICSKLCNYPNSHEAAAMAMEGTKIIIRKMVGDSEIDKVHFAKQWNEDDLDCELFINDEKVAMH